MSRRRMRTSPGQRITCTVMNVSATGASHRVRSLSLNFPGRCGVTVPFATRGVDVASTGDPNSVSTAIGTRGTIVPDASRARYSQCLRIKRIAGSHANLRLQRP
jgi:hypothetical protein